MIGSKLKHAAVLFRLIFTYLCFQSYTRRSLNNSSNVDRVVTIESNMQDDVWGQSSSLSGQLGSFVLFNDVLKDNQLRSLYQTGNVFVFFAQSERVCVHQSETIETKFKKLMS